MRISFAKSCKLCIFFLVAIATIAVVGVPLENVTRTLITEQVKTDDTFPDCPSDLPELKAALCDSNTKIRMYCARTGSPIGIILYKDCAPDETCIEHSSFPRRTPHASCAGTKQLVNFNNFGNTGAVACSGDAKFDNGGQTRAEIAMTVYGDDGKPIVIDWLNANLNGNELPKALGKRNFTSVVQNYNKDDTVKFCMFTSNGAKVSAFGGVVGV